MYNPQIHHRRSIRLKNYDYSQKGLHFITLIVKNRKHLFGKIDNGQMNLNALGKIATEEWLNSIKVRHNISLGDFIFMPDHFHAIVSIDYKLNDRNKERIGKFISPTNTLGAIIRGFKGATTKQINEYIREVKKSGALEKGEDLKGELQFAPGIVAPGIDTPGEVASGEGSIWQRNYHSKLITSERALFNISEYIKNNPKNWRG